MSRPIAYIVDDIESNRKLLEKTLASVDVRTQSHESARAFLDKFDPDCPGCILLDIRMPEMSGLGLQQELNKRGVVQPQILVSAHADVPIAVQAMKQGAFEFIEKPIRTQEVIDVVYRAFRQCDQAMAEREEREAFHSNLDRLSEREKEVMTAMVGGHLNKQLAFDLGISQRTVEVHRANVMAKMKVGSLAELVQLTVRFGAQQDG